METAEKLFDRAKRLNGGELARLHALLEKAVPHSTQNFATA